MSRFEETKSAFFSYLRSIGAEPGLPIDLFDVGPALIGLGFEQEEIADVLIALERQDFIALVEGNRLKLLKRV